MIHDKRKGKPEEASEGWESLVEEPSEGSLAPSAELEQAMREAADAIEAQRSDAAAPQSESPEGTTGGTQEELAALTDRYVRLAADFENFRRRALREREEAHQFGHQNLVKDLLPTVDNLARAIEHARDSEATDLEGLLRGVELVERELLASLAKHGLSVIRAEGERFDPSLHEAMAQVEDEQAPEGAVVQVLQRGYSLRDRLLRPARVVVSKRPADAQGPQGQASEGEPEKS
ncbi:MAG: nucleotide exchange factor GrpE [Myxococcota bacterium]